MVNFFRKIKYGIENLIYFLPYIWNDRDWDYDFIYELLYIKLKKMEEHWEEYDGWLKSIDHENNLKDIKVAKNLCRRITDDNYLRNSLFWHDKKYGDYINFNEYISKKPNKDGLYDWIGDTNKKRSESFSRCSRHSDKIRNRDVEYLYELLKKKSRRWWI